MENKWGKKLKLIYRLESKEMIEERKKVKKKSS